jgi:hypothetical protein
MICVQCNSPYATTDNFCRHCGSPVKYAAPQQANANEENKQAVTLLLICMCWWAFIGLLYLLLNKVVLAGAASINRVKVYEIISWFTQLTTFLMMLIFSIIVKSNRIRVFLIVFTVVQLLIIVGYKLLKDV